MRVSLLLFFLVQTAFGASVPIDLKTVDIMKQRDPFKMPTISKLIGPRSELQLFPADQFKLVGVLKGSTQRRAMISAPNGKTYFVQERMAIGQKKGLISKITDSEILIREKSMNVLGEEEDVDTELKLPSDGKQDVRTLTSGEGW